jgi:hypothetical protein
MSIPRLDDAGLGFGNIRLTESGVVGVISALNFGEVSSLVDDFFEWKHLSWLCVVGHKKKL